MLRLHLETDSLRTQFPFQLNSLGGPGTFGFYTATNMLSFFLGFLFVRETKQLTLEELDQVGDFSSIGP